VPSGHHGHSHHENVKDRLATILVAPLMSCSARLPVYTLLIAACIPNQTVLGVFETIGLTMLAMYLLGIVVALLMAWLFKRTLLRGEPPMLIMELPPYKRPVAKVVLRHMWDRARLFLRRAGTVILGISILLWFLSTYPRQAEIEQDFAARKPKLPSRGHAASENDAAAQKTRDLAMAELDQAEAGEKLRHSFAGRFGHLIEPASLLWVSIGRSASALLRPLPRAKVFVSTLSTVYNVGSEKIQAR